MERTIVQPGTGANSAAEAAGGGADRSFVSFQRVQKTYDGETLVVRDLDLDVPRGEFLTLLGPSGSGKTTTLMMLAGFETPTEGRIMLGGRQLNHVPPHKRNLGMVFQNYALFPHMSVAENLAFPLGIRRTPAAEIEKRVAHALEMVHLEAFRNRRPTQLSGGQQQRVAVARALIFEPEIVLMDEPLGALDKKLREEMMYEIKALHDRLGVTMLYVTHDQGEALTMSDRIAVFADGIVQQCGAPRELYEQPANAFVADFIGENNHLAGVVRHVQDASCRVELDDAGGEVRGLVVQDLAVGERCVLAVRPEQVRIAPPAGSVPNLFEGRVESVIFQGDFLRAVIRAAGLEGIVAKVPNIGLDHSFRAGGIIPFGWGASVCRAFRCGSAGPGGGGAAAVQLT
jgi:putative spermidine/putrescine transport system ATP-binding protein